MDQSRKSERALKLSNALKKAAARTFGSSRNIFITLGITRTTNGEPVVQVKAYDKDRESEKYVAFRDIEEAQFDLLEKMIDEAHHDVRKEQWDYKRDRARMPVQRTEG